MSLLHDFVHARQITLIFKFSLDASVAHLHDNISRRPYAHTSPQSQCIRLEEEELANVDSFKNLNARGIAARGCLRGSIIRLVLRRGSSQATLPKHTPATHMQLEARHIPPVFPHNARTANYRKSRQTILTMWLYPAEQSQFDYSVQHAKAKAHLLLFLILCRRSNREEPCISSAT